MNQEVTETLEACRKWLRELGGTFKTGSLFKEKNDTVLKKIDKILPTKPLSLDPKNYDSELVYQKRN